MERPIISAPLVPNDDVSKSKEVLTPEELRRSEAYCQLARLYPPLEQMMMDGPEDDITRMVTMIQRGVTRANSDDIKSLRSKVLQWIAPPNGQLSPPLRGSLKADQGFHHSTTGSLLCPVHLNWLGEGVRDALLSREVDSASYWPYFVFRDFIYCPEDPWAGLLQSTLLVTAFQYIRDAEVLVAGREDAQAPEVTLSSIAYIATHVRYALSSDTVFFSRDVLTEAHVFYDSMLRFFELHKNDVRLQSILAWWAE
ncbi:hypothetical protein DXG01_003289 [Tephrocybe rancida]|nr:hypothetical protein DXG01_003289 [Tephrocybe rancida]